jgi:hypothetical protein
MEMQLLHDLVIALCTIAGMRKVRPETFYSEGALRAIARTNQAESSTDQGRQIRKYLKFEIATWNSEIWLKGKQLAVSQCQAATMVLLDLRGKDGTGRNSYERRMRAVAILGLRRCKWEAWRTKCVKGEYSGVEFEFLGLLAEHILDGADLRDVS